MKTYSYILLISLIGALLFSTACNNSQQTEDKKDDKLTADILSKKEKILELSKNAVIYEVNIRQFTPEGTFKAFEKHIPVLKEMGIDILWLMPIFPISKENRKGSLGSYYAVDNYRKINPEFGNEKDLHQLIETAHKNKMLVILDWVANHTGWGNPWIKAHPKWYTQDSTGQIIMPAGTDWSDVADLNYDNKAMRNEMINSMKYWLKDFDIDGFRCDVAMMVPTDFWNNARVELDKIKPVFMLAEAEEPDLTEKAFDMNYAWHLHFLMNEIAQGKLTADTLRRYFEDDAKKYPQEVYRMIFTSNHDENSWKGSVFERMPDSYKTFAAFSFTAPGFPLIYSGQEVGLSKRLKFFDKDTVDRSKPELQDFYAKLIQTKKDNPALWNGKAGSKAYFPNTSKPEQILSFIRKKDKNKVLFIANFSDKETNFMFREDSLEIQGDYKNVFSDKEFKIEINKTYIFAPWEYMILTTK